MKIASLKAKVKHKCSVSQFQLEWYNKQEEVWAEKNIRVESEQARGGGSGAWEDRVGPTQQVGQDRWPSRDFPPSC